MNTARVLRIVDLHFNLQLTGMEVLQKQELAEMERLLARLLSSANEDREHSAILRLHHRIVSIFENQKTLRKSQARLNAITRQTSQ